MHFEAHDYVNGVCFGLLFLHQLKGLKNLLLTRRLLDTRISFGIPADLIVFLHRA